MADEKYRLTLEGSEIDEALLRLANYEDEGLVLGSRKGVMLGPGSEYYHKNARYYAELAQSAVPGDTTSAVRWDIDQSALTNADREMARKNIRAGGSNRNLLDNPFFTVNQRSFTTGTNGSYFADRWKLSTSNLITATRNSDGTVTFTKTSGSTASFIMHYIDQQTGLDEEAYYTASLMDGDGNVYSVTEKFVPGTQSEKPVFINGMRVAIGLYGKGAQIWMGLYLQPASSGNFTLKAAKLELGSVSTLANDVPPDYGQELDKCLYYFERIKGVSGYHAYGVGIAETATQASIIVPMHSKRTTSFTMSASGAFALYNGGIKTATLSLGSGRSSNALVVTATGSGLTAGGCYQLVTNSSADAYIDISADL